jgi:hypothetical protein
MYGTLTLAFQRIFVRMKIISLISIRFSYVSLIRNSVTGPLEIDSSVFKSVQISSTFFPGLYKKLKNNYCVAMTNMTCNASLRSVLA